jgi:hypothetical protein
MKGKIVLCGLAIVFTLIISVLCARMYHYGTDFPVFYRAAAIILDPSTPNGSVYSTVGIDKYALPEQTESNAYIYSMAAAYILAPLALMPYFVAKASLIFVNIIAYFFAVTIVMRLVGASGRWFLYPLALSFIWLPFDENLIFGQINAILLLLVTLAVLAAFRKRPALAGVLLALAALFKIFPLAIAMVLGLKNWRILAACAVTFGMSFLIPGSGQWLAAMANIYSGGYTDIYQYFSQFGPIWFWLYAGTLGGLTALITYHSKSADYPLVASLAIPAALLAMPIVEFYHFTMLIFPFIYLLAICKTHKVFIVMLILSIATICSSVAVDVQPIQFAGLFTLWLVAAIFLWRFGNEVQTEPNI